MPRKLLIIAGAPAAHDLDWHSDELHDDFVAPFSHIDLFQLHVNREPGSQSCAIEPDDPIWRSIPLQRSRLPTGFSQHHDLHDAYRPDINFISTVTDSFQDTTDYPTEVHADHSAFLEQLYEHSLVVPRGTADSQWKSQSFSTTESSISDSQDVSANYSAQKSQVQGSGIVPAALDAHLSDLEDLPKAGYLESISPQTMTVNIITGIISIAEPRTVQTRWGSTKSLVEMILGDDTKSGLSVTFWLSDNARPAARADPSSAESVLKTLRRQDIILLRNVALGTFSNKVHGHSLHNGMTKIHLLHRRKLDKSDQSGLYTTREMSSRKVAHPQLAKARKVWDWTISFVADSEQPLGKRKLRGRPLRSWEMPPPDTQ